jgi:hypothetical protein
MDNSITALNASAAAPSTANLSTQTGSTQSSSFEEMLNTILQADSNGQVNEEQLFAAVINERISTKKGEEAASAYRELFTSYQQELQWENGYVPVEQAAGKALEGLVEQGILMQSEAESINAQAFKAAQIDDKTDILYDSLGSTVAVTLVDLAIQSAEKETNLFDSGQKDAGSMPINTSYIGSTNEGTAGTFQGGDGFLYKPVSESTGNLVILLPASMKGDVASLDLVDSSGEVLESGDTNATYEDGRPIFRFNEPGSAYPDGLVVRVTMDDGTTKEYTIPDSAKRWT